jgi:hypothetical protein
MTDDAIEMEVFRAGNFGMKGSYSIADLDSIAQDYSAGLLEAPLTLDHAQSGPAFGWVSALRRIGDRLVATVRGIPVGLLELLRKGDYKRRSIELIRRFTATGRPYLRAVSLLGAATPAVPGLRDITFEEDSGDVITFPGEAAAPVAESTTAHLESEIARMHGLLSQFKCNERLQQADELFSELRGEGVALTPKDAAVLRHLIGLENSDVVIFEEKHVPVVDWLKHFLRSLGAQRVPLGEVAAETTAPDATGDALSFSDRVDANSITLHQLALAEMQQNHGLSYASALSRAARRQASNQ